MTFTSTPAMPTTSLSAELAGWASKVGYGDIPAGTVAAARSQLISNIAAIRASRAHPIGRSIVSAFGSPTQTDPTQSAYVLAALATALDFDEVAYAGHISAGAVNVAIAETARAERDGRSVLSTIVTANECAARITAATILSPFFRGQTNTHCHLASAATARLHAREASVSEWIAALGLALGTVPVPLHHGVVTSDVKVLSAAAPVRLALDACDAAEAGLAGPEDIIEHPEGLLAHLSVVALPEAVTLGLGHRWHTDTLTYKRFPGSAYLHAAFDCAQRLYQRLGPIPASAVRRIVVKGSLLTVQLQQKVAPFLSGPRTSVAAATLSVGYGVATLLLTGALRAADLTPRALAEAERWSLAEKVTVEHDWQLSVHMAQATSPLGEALRQAGDRALALPELRAWAGERAKDVLAGLGPTERTFEHATMAIGAEIELELTDGTLVEETCPAPIGSAGIDTRRHHVEIVREKFLATGGSPDALANLERLDLLGPAATRRALVDALNSAVPD